MAPPKLYQNYDYDCSRASFITIPLGTAGGLDESNLSSFLLTKKGSNVFIALDAGTIWAGVSQFISSSSKCSRFFDITYPSWATTVDQKVAWFIRNHILGYFIGHSHLDHVQGLIESSPEDYLSSIAFDFKPPINNGLLQILRSLLSPAQQQQSNPSPTILQKKSIIGLPYTINAIQTHLFNNVIFPNLPSFGRYEYFTLDNTVKYNLIDLVTVNETQKSSMKGQFPNNIQITPFELCHNDIMSSAFLFQDMTTNEQIVFFSDTGVPSGNYNCDWKEKINVVWRNIKIDKLKAIFIESSFTSNTSDSQMYGHLRPKDVMALMEPLLMKSQQTIPRTTSLRHVKLIIEHIKPLANQFYSRLSLKQQIFKELTDNNPFNINVIIPQQGEPICI
ncbi:cAMP phosphodiesterase [Cavenderia fasciculata]|uniref:cAMP phosphodiesterase n=1 Tax=Cavenderia fasciculata TaxID=261658 RepID=F4Q2V5_CACFS|nr:cAMP phosphodiesterase [Cavenderia fasciculata]EGG16731.1 cAMP phosphodiesterase [Cavenderia fasciculata]|eukprot:XP_004355205.1 cAMP phosphodiesterase [Cavenderia fasciculata]